MIAIDIGQLSWRFLPAQPVWVQSLCLLILLGSLGLTILLANRRLSPQRIRFGWVAGLNVVAFTALIGVLSQFWLNNTEAPPVVLVTVSDQQPDTIAESIQQVGSDAQIFVTQTAIAHWQRQLGKQPSLPPHWQRLSLPEQVLISQPGITKLHIIGDGLSQRQWQTIAHLTQARTAQPYPFSMTYSPTLPRTGLIDMAWQKQLPMGAFQSLSGRLQTANQDTQIYALALLGPTGETLQQQRLRSAEPFSFHFQPKTTGQWRYRLQLSRADGSLVQTEDVTFSVVSPAPLSILIKQSAPSFETRQLKNWAAKYASKVLIETQISEHHFITQALNLSHSEVPPAGVSILDGELAEADLLIIDGRALLALTQAQMTGLTQAVNQGLGLLVLADANLLAASFPSQSGLLEGITIVRDPALPPQREVQLLWANNQTEQPVSVFNAQLKLNAKHGQPPQILVSDAQTGEVVVGVKRNRGYVALSLFNASYQWQTAGNRGRYSHYWQTIMQALARSATPPYWLPADPQRIYAVGEAREVCLASGPAFEEATNPGKAEQHTTAGVIELKLSRHPFYQQQICSSVWASQVGWQQLRFEQPQRLAQQFYYAYGPTDWLSWQQTNKHRATQAVLSRTQPATAGKHRTLLANGWGWWLLMLSSILLWLERKFYAVK